MPAPKVSYSDLEDAFSFANEETRHAWLDKRTGRILSYSEEAVAAVEEGDLDDLPDWLKPDVEAATEVLRAFGELPGQQEQGPGVGSQVSVDGAVSASDDQDSTAVEPDRYLSIEQIPSHEAFQFMADFIDDLDNPRAQGDLSGALAGSKPFRRFKNVLLDFPKEREQWFEYEARRRREYIEEWASEQGVELDFDRGVS